MTEGHIRAILLLATSPCDAAEWWPLIRRLPGRYAECAVLSYCHGYTPTQIASHMGVSRMRVYQLLAAIKSRYRRSVVRWLGDTETETEED